MKARIGISAKASVAEPGRIERSLGKAKRVIDKKLKEHDLADGDPPSLRCAPPAC